VNSLAYGNQSAEKVGPQVEEIVRKDIGASGPVVYRMEQGDTGATNLATVLGDIGSVFGSGGTVSLFTLEFDLPGPLPARLRAGFERQGLGCYCGSLLFLVPLAKSVPAEVSIEDHKGFGTPKFIGQPDLAARLNAVKDLAKRVDKVLRSEWDMGSIKVKAPRIFKLAPENGAAVLVMRTLPRLTSMGFGASTDAGEILNLAGVIDAAL
jgi:hypothetical protein